MKTFFIQTLGCKVNHYESDQIAALLLSRGLMPADSGSADLRVINTCSVTMQAASQSRQSVRRLVRLPILTTSAAKNCSSSTPSSDEPLSTNIRHPQDPAVRSRVIVTGCWATSNTAEASALPGVDAVLGHHHNVAFELDRLLVVWQEEESRASACCVVDQSNSPAASPESLLMDNGRQVEVGTRVGQRTDNIEPNLFATVNGKVEEVQSEECGVKSEMPADQSPRRIHSSLFTLHSSLTSPGTTSLPMLGQRQSTRQRAFLKIQDGCDAHCTYCIIPSLRPTLWSKPVDAAVEEATALVAAGHVEIVLTGIFLGAYGQSTALRRRQDRPTAEKLGALIEALCTRVPGLRRLRLSSLEPGDLTPTLLAVLRSHPQVVPHFHLPLQSGSDALLRRMNRQYTRDDFLQMTDQVRAAFDRPALTTDIVVGFPGETDAEFDRTVEVVRAAGFIHVHAFPYSPRPGTAAARWTKQFVRGPVVNERIALLREIAADQSFAFRSSFLGQTVEVIIERDSESSAGNPRVRHGRCERYFDVEIDDAKLQPGDSVRTLITQVERESTMGNALLSDLHS